MFNHLRPYLHEVKTVIIPDLGAITITNPDTNETMFMAFLKHDDGKFAAYIAEREGMDVETARAQLHTAVEEIQSKLNAEGKVAIAGLGNFILKDGEIDFVMESDAAPMEAAPEPTLTEPEAMEPAVSEQEFIEPVAIEPEVIEPEISEAEPHTSEENTEEDAQAEEEVPTPAAETPEVEPEVTEAPATAIPLETQAEVPAESTPAVEDEASPAAEVEIPVEEVEPIQEVETTPEAPQQVEDEIPAAPTEEKPTPIIPLHAETTEAAPEMNILQKEQMAASQKKLDDLRKAKEAKPAKKKRGAGFWMLMVLLALLAVGGTFVGIYYDEVKKHVPFLADAETEKDSENTDLDTAETTSDEGAETDENTDETIDEESDAEEASEETVEETTPEPENTPEPVATSSGSAMPWHLIAGTFSVEANAQRLADNLRKAGFSPTIRQVGAMYLVSAKGFATKEAALAGKSELSTAAPKAWLYEWK